MNDGTLNDDTLHDEELRAAARSLGEGGAARVDVERVAAGVLAGLRAPAALPRRGPWAVPGWLRVAAAVVVLAGGAFAARQLMITTPTHLVQEDLADLEASDLTELLETLDQTLDLSRPNDGPDLEGLNETQLEAILRSLEG